MLSCIRTILCLPVVNRLSALQCSDNVKKTDHEKKLWFSECLPADFSPGSFSSGIQSVLTTGNRKPDFGKRSVG